MAEICYEWHSFTLLRAHNEDMPKKQTLSDSILSIGKSKPILRYQWTTLVCHLVTLDPKQKAFRNIAPETHSQRQNLDS